MQFITLLAPLLLASGDAPVVLRAGTVHLVEEGVVLTDGAVLMRDGKIVRAGTDLETPAGATEIDYGPDAVIIEHADLLEPVDGVLVAATSSHENAGSGGDVLGDRVLTDTGTDLGKVADVVIEYDNATGGACDVVGYEIEASDALKESTSKSKHTRLLLPLPDTLAASSEHVMVPASAEQFVSQDLAGFGAAVQAFRAQLGGQS